MTIILIGVGVLIYLLCGIGMNYLWNRNHATTISVIGQLLIPMFAIFILVSFIPFSVLVGLSVFLGKPEWVETVMKKRK